MDRKGQQKQQKDSISGSISLLELDDDPYDA